MADKYKDIEWEHLYPYMYGELHAELDLFASAVKRMIEHTTRTQGQADGETMRVYDTSKRLLNLLTTHDHYREERLKNVQCSDLY